MVAFGEGVLTFTGGETLGFFCFRHDFFVEALAAWMLGINTSGGVLGVYGSLLMLFGDAVWPAFDRRFGARHGWKLRNGKIWLCGERIVIFVKDTERVCV